MPEPPHVAVNELGLDLSEAASNIAAVHLKSRRNRDGWFSPRAHLAPEFNVEGTHLLKKLPRTACQLVALRRGARCQRSVQRSPAALMRASERAFACSRSWSTEAWRTSRLPS